MAGGRPAWSADLWPLTEMSGTQTYKGEELGLYGAGRNEPPRPHLEAALRQSARIAPLNCEGKPDPDGAVGLLAIGFSNTFHEFSDFEHLMRADAQVSARVRPVNGAQDHVCSATWASTAGDGSQAPINPWSTLDQRLAGAGVAAPQVQAAWIKLTSREPAMIGEFPRHVERMTAELRTIARFLKQRFLNLRLAFFSSRIFGGYATTPLSPEPYAYESAFSVRRLILQQIRGDAELNFDPENGPVRAPLLLWGPYLWARGRLHGASSEIGWTRDDFGEDGTHPSAAGSRRVANQLLTFFKTTPIAQPWFLRPR